MPIATKSAIALVAIFLALFAGAWVTLDVAVRPSFEQQERAAHQRNIERLQANLDEVARDVASKARDYARWDDTYEFMLGRNPSYVEDNFDDEWLANYGAHLVAIVDDHSRVLWTLSVRPDEQTDDDLELARRVVEAAMTIVPADGSSAHGVIWSVDGPLVFGAARSTHSDGGGAPHGLVVMARRLADPAIYAQLQLDFSFLPADQPSNVSEAHFAALRARAEETWASDAIRYGLLPLRNGEDLVGAVLTEQRRDITALGRQTIATTLAALTLMFACILAACWWLLRRTVTARLAVMTRHFQTDGAEATPLPLPPSQDEIGQLTRAYNALLARLRVAVASEQRALGEREAAKAENQMKSDFLSNISCELRTPLNAIVGYAELIHEEVSEIAPESSIRDIQNIIGAARQLLTLTNEILDLSRIESDRLELCPEAFRVDEMLQAVIATGGAFAAAQANDLEVQVAADIGEAYTDHVRLRQCLINVLLHACKRTHSSVVRLSASRITLQGQDTLLFEITDTGSPLTSSQVDALFEPYVRNAAVPGAGARLGLAVTRKLLALMGGEITIACTEAGCAFTVVVPAIQMEARRNPVPALAAA